MLCLENQSCIILPLACIHSLNWAKSVFCNGLLKGKTLKPRVRTYPWYTRWGKVSRRHPFQRIVQQSLLTRILSRI